MKNLYLSLFLLAVTVTNCCLAVPATTSKPILRNKEIDFVLNWLKLAFTSGKFNEVSVPDIYTDLVTIKNAKLSDVATLSRAGDVYLEEPKIDNLRTFGSFKLDKFKLVVEDFRYKDFSGPATFTADKDSVKVSYQLLHHSKPGQCEMHWESFQLRQFDHVIMQSKNPGYQNKDITDEVNNIILPNLNKYINSEKYRKILNKTLDFCIVNLFRM